MQLKKLVFSLLGTLVCLVAFSGHAMAKDGFDFRVSLGADLMMIHADARIKDGMHVADVDSDAEHDFNGITGKISIGYQYKYVGFYLEQNLGGFLQFQTSDEDNKKRQFDGDAGEFFGGSYFVVRGILPITDNFQIDLGVGAGVIYSNGDEHHELNGSNMYDPSLNSDYYMRPVVYDHELDPSYAFAMKFTFSAAYFITDLIGIGVFLDYNLGIKTLDLNDNIEETIYFHDVDPGIQLIIHL